MNSDPAKLRETKALLSASTSRLNRLRGLTEAVGAILRIERPKGHMALRDACRRLAEMHPRPPGPVFVCSVREGRRTVGHRVADDDSVIRIAHGVANGRTMEAVVTGALVPKVAKVAGLRTARRKPWASDPGKAAELEAIADRFLSAWSPLLIEGVPGDGWAFALVVPHPRGSGVPREGTQCLVFVEPDGSVCEMIALGVKNGPRSGVAAHPEDVRAAITEALAADGCRIAKADDIWRGPGGVQEDFDAGAIVGCHWDDTDYGFWRRIDICWGRMRSTALARLRRLLPDEIQEHAALCRNQFSDLQSASGFMMKRRGWKPRDYLYANQAIRAAPLIKDVILRDEVCLAVRAGRPLDEVLRAAVLLGGGDPADGERPLHPKTVKAMRGTWNLTSKRRIELDRIARVVPVVDGIYRANPHHPVFRPREMGEVAWLATMGDVDPAYGMRAVLAHRDAKGRIKGVEDMHDVYQWMCGKCCVALIGREHPEDDWDSRRVSRAVFDVMFPPDRTLAGTSALVDQWHRDEGRLNETYRRLFGALVAAALAADTGQEPEDLMALMFPHFLEGEVTIDGVTMKPLVDHEEIIREGEEMEHCVGGYGRFASAGYSLLVSQVSEEDRSTVEVGIENDYRESDETRVVRLVVRQNRTRKNGEPPARHHAAIAKLVRSLTESEKIALAERAERAAVATNMHGNRGFDALSARDLGRLRDHVYGGIRRFMPRSLKRLTRHEWMARYPEAG